VLKSQKGYYRARRIRKSVHKTANCALALLIAKVRNDILPTNACGFAIKYWNFRKLESFWAFLNFSELDQVQLTHHHFIFFLFKGEIGELQFYFRKIPLHQQKFLGSSVLSIRLGCREIWKNVRNETTKLFSVGNTNINISTNQG